MGVADASFTYDAYLHKSLNRRWDSLHTTNAEEAKSPELREFFHNHQLVLISAFFILAQQ